MAHVEIRQTPAGHAILIDGVDVSRNTRRVEVQIEPGPKATVTLTITASRDGIVYEGDADIDIDFQCPLCDQMVEEHQHNRDGRDVRLPFIQQGQTYPAATTSG